jgi:type III pantothenate kinase
MILTIDIGNSNIVLGGVRDQEIVFEARLRTEATKTSDQYCVDLKILMEVYVVNNTDIEGTIIASVVPQVLNSMRTAVQKLTGKVPLVVGPGL